MLADELIRQHGLLALLTLPVFAWYLRQAKRLMQLIKSWLRRLRSTLRDKGQMLLLWLLVEEINGYGDGQRRRRSG